MTILKNYRESIEKHVSLELTKIKQEVDIEFCKWFMFVYDKSEEKFPVNIQKLVELKVYDRKDSAKKKLISNFTEDTDFVVIKIAPIQIGAITNNPSLGENKKSIKTKGGQNKEEIFITTECFKSMCMIPNNEMGKKVRSYYLLLERIVKSFIEAESNRLIKELKIENETLSREIVRIDSEKNNLLKRHNYHKFKKGPVLYIVSDGEQRDCDSCKREIRYKVGIDSKNINTRLKQYRTAIPYTKLHFLLYIPDNSLLEKCVLTRFKKNLSPYQNHEWIFGVSIDRIISFINKTISFLKLEHTTNVELESYNNSVCKFVSEDESNDKFVDIIFVD